MTSLPFLALTLILLAAFLGLSLIVLDMVEDTRAERPARWTSYAFAVAFLALLIGAADVPV